MQRVVIIFYGDLLFFRKGALIKVKRIAATHDRIQPSTPHAELYENVPQALSWQTIYLLYQTTQETNRPIRMTGLNQR